METKEFQFTWFESFCAKVLGMGPIPKHYAIIMDGHRHHSRAHNIHLLEVYEIFTLRILQTLHWCLALGIPEMSVYVFSIRNYGRTKEEIYSVFAAIKKLYNNFENDTYQLMEKGVCIRTIGNLAMLPPDIQKCAARVMLQTSANKKAYLNLYLSYTAQDEITNAVNEILQGVNNSLIRSSDITEQLLGQTLYSAASPDPDLLIRTSGVTHLSHFLLWQNCYSVMYIFKALGPDYTIWNFYAAILHYQTHCSKSKALKDKGRIRSEKDLHEWESQQILLEYGPEATEEDFASYHRKKEERVKLFLEHVWNKRQEKLKNMARMK